MTNEFHQLETLKNHPGYQILQELWIKQGKKIMEACDRAAAKGQETSWRYWAGQAKGFEMAVGQLERALVDIERDAENKREEFNARKIIDEINGKKEPL